MLAIIDGNSTNTENQLTGLGSLPNIYMPQVPQPTQPFGCYVTYQAYNLTAVEQASIVNFDWTEATQGVTYLDESQSTSSAMSWQSFQPLMYLAQTLEGWTNVDINFDLQIFSLFFHYTNSYNKLTVCITSNSLMDTLGRYNLYYAIADYRSNTWSTATNTEHAYTDNIYMGALHTDSILGMQFQSLYYDENYATSNMISNGGSINYTRCLTALTPSVFGQNSFPYYKPALWASQSYTAETNTDTVLSDYISFYVPPYEVGTYSAGYQDGKEAGKTSGFNEGYNTGFENGYEVGYSNGLVDGENSTYQGPFTLLGQAFASTTQILELEVFPHVTIGALIFIPVAVTVMIAIFKMIKR